MFGPFPVFELQNLPMVVFIKKPEDRSSLLENTVSSHFELCFEYLVLLLNHRLRNLIIIIIIKSYKYVKTFKY